VRYETRPTADAILGVDVRDPLFVRWQYGLGRAAVFTSDAKSRWAANWIGWPGYDRFWQNVARDLLPHAPAIEATAEIDSSSEELVVRYRLARGAAEPTVIPDVFAMGPNGFRQPMLVSKVAAGEFRAQVRIGSNQGLFRVRPLEESRAFPEIGVYRPESEMTDFGSDDALLQQIAQTTGGHFRPSVEQLFDSGGQTEPSTMRLWPGLVALALCLHLTELITRKWAGLRLLFAGAA
jgi:Ca-activated chloride channel family protein